MISLSAENYGFLTNYVHLAFLAGIILGYLYFRRNRVSVGGTLAVGYLAASLYAPLNVVVTIVTAFVAFLLIRLVILKVYLPRPRQIFAIGLTVGVVLNGAWLGLSHYLIAETSTVNALQLVGVIVPGMLCNSLVKQGVSKTVIPLAVMIPAAAMIGLTLAAISHAVNPTPAGSGAYAPGDYATETTTFVLSAVSVLLAVVIQESTVRSLKLRTAGYITAGILASAASSPAIILVVLTVCVLVAAVWIPYSVRTPLFGKDRFFVLLMLSFVFTVVTEALFFRAFGMRFDGPQNVVFAVLPAIIVNDVVQYGPKRTALGFGLSAAGCATIAASLSLAT
ncbi:poly-gamma-glutamate biosynthesis protein PgsC/CapC [Corynebacterium sanguinis]|uniref:poly-gamma-glutamate biosynthesis protein PgsC/CapC n=1 Tax=Corynebacterium sanguinis TaxID=2594913 RepID=UPI0011A3E9F1|nr:poly-gamma-glutamate biosynthesis protein PgsC/CapC [Corynebacterium sanguinis]MCT1664424.1 poly-gamma-glutamate biosynthesis protein PgsC/CapC [Corynebacterium sanguinis]TVS28359.1 hypothetical protein EKI56_00890 [Corynebacterium sanguinis]